MIKLHLMVHESEKKNSPPKLSHPKHIPACRSVFQNLNNAVEDKECLRTHRQATIWPTVHRQATLFEGVTRACLWATIRLQRFLILDWGAGANIVVTGRCLINLSLSVIDLSLILLLASQNSRYLISVAVRYPFLSDSVTRTK